MATSQVDVAIVGAGPYGLSLAAHLRAARVPFRQFGLPMRSWRAAMPEGMMLKSQGFASNLSSPDGHHTLEEFCRTTGRPYAAMALPTPVQTFIDYGMWFQRELVPDVEQTLVSRVVRQRDGFEVTLESGELVRAGHVVVAAGLEHFAAVHDQLSSLPPALSTHTSAHSDLSVFRGKTVIVLGAGQSAIESAALLHERGAAVQLVARGPKINWNYPVPAPGRPLVQRLRDPQSALGAGWRMMVVAECPGLWQYRPEATRVRKAWTILGPGGAHWLSERVTGKVPVLLEQALTWAKADGDQVTLGFDGPNGTQLELTADHVLSGTGYHADVRRLTFLDQQVLSGLRLVADTPIVDRHFQSTVPGLHFTGALVAPTFGPVMRFVHGTRFAARTLAGHLSRVTR